MNTTTSGDIHSDTTPRTRGSRPGRSLGSRCKLQLLRSYAWFRSTNRRRRSPGPERNRSVVIVTPASPGGLGDDALVNSLAWALRARGFTEIICANHGDSISWSLRGIPSINIRLPKKGLLSWITFLENIRSAEAIAVIGADMIDGHYGDGPSLNLLQVADLAARMGMESTVIGASFNDKPSGAVTQFIAGMSQRVRLLARDSISRSRIQAFRSAPTELVADIAFLLQPASGDRSTVVREASEWITQQRLTGSKLILGCNINPYPVVRAGGSADTLIERYAEAIIELHRHLGKVGVVYISHDRREPYNDVPSLLALDRLLPAEVPRYTDLLAVNGTAAEMKALAGCCDLLLVGRMHLAIAALGSGVPVGGIAYQGKFEGLYQHFDLREMVLDANAALQPRRVADWFLNIAERRQELRAQVAEKLPHVIGLAWKNLTPDNGSAGPSLRAADAKGHTIKL